jgi:hypothetical protein
VPRSRSHLANRIAQQARAIERDEAARHGKITFLGKILVQCTLPHRDPGRSPYQRSNGFYRLTILSPPEIGIPWGRYPRLLLAWLTTEALRTKSPSIQLGRSLSDFMQEVGVTPSGGPRGPIARFRDQVERLFASTIVSHYRTQNEVRTFKLDVAQESRLWWRPSMSDQTMLWGSYVQLTDEFFRSVTEHAVPLDTRALRVLHAPLAIDLYAWATYRASYLRNPTAVPWASLAAQFGGSYKDVKHFKAAAVKQLGRIVRLYPDLRVKAEPEHLVLRPSSPHIKRRSPY